MTRFRSASALFFVVVVGVVIEGAAGEEAQDDRAASGEDAASHPQPSHGNPSHDQPDHDAKRPEKPAYDNEHDNNEQHHQPAAHPSRNEYIENEGRHDRREDIHKRTHKKDEEESWVNCKSTDFCEKHAGETYENATKKLDADRKQDFVNGGFTKELYAKQFCCCHRGEDHENLECWRKETCLTNDHSYVCMKASSTSDGTELQPTWIYPFSPFLLPIILTLLQWINGRVWK